MWIERISLEGFGPFVRSQTVEFTAHDVNLVLGPNEAGKSLLVGGLCAVLFGERPSATARLRSWQATEGGRFRGTVQLRTRDGRALRLTRDFASETLTAAEIRGETEQLLFSGRVTPGTRRGSVVQPYESLLTEILGFSSRTIFEQTLCVRQTMLSTVFAGELREIASGSARANYIDVRTRLLERCEEITRDRPPDSGQRRLTHERALEQTVERRRQLDGELDQAERWAQEMAELQAERDRMLQNIERTRQARDVQLEQIDVADRYAQTLDRYLAARSEHVEQLEQLRTLRDTLRDAQRVEQDLDRQYGPLREVGDDFLVTLGEIEALEGEVDESGARVNRLAERLQEQRVRRRWLACGWFGSGAIVMGVGLVLLLTQATAATFYGVLGVGGLACVCGTAAFWWTSRKVSILRTRREAAIEQRHSVETRYGRLMDRHGQIIGDRSAEVVRKEYREYRQKLNEHTQLLAQAQVRVGEKDALRERVAELDASHAAARTQLDEMRVEHPWVERWDDDRERVDSFLEEARRTGDETEREVDALEKRLTETEKNLAVKVATATADPARLRDERESLDSRIADLERERDALYLAWRVLDECIDEFSRTALTRVNERASQLFETFTDGRYTRIHLTDRLEPKVDSASRTEISPEELSTGACDQMYLAIRIAFAEMLAGREGLPIILDDPFANFDAGRLHNALRTLELIAKDRQVILLTHDYRVGRIGKVAAQLGQKDRRDKT